MRVFQLIGHALEQRVDLAIAGDAPGLIAIACVHATPIDSIELRVVVVVLYQLPNLLEKPDLPLPGVRHRHGQKQEGDVHKCKGCGAHRRWT